MCIKSDLKLTLKMAQCSVLCDLSFDMLDIATFGLIITVRQLWTEKYVPV